MELEISRGRGYVPADQNKKEGSAVGTIVVDSIFTPIIKVNFTVENTRVGQRTDYDRLLVEIFTNGFLPLAISITIKSCNSLLFKNSLFSLFNAASQV